MSNRELEEQRELEIVNRLAGRLDLSSHQLEELDWNLDEHVGNDGAVYGYTITFERSEIAGAQELIDRITDRQGWVQIGPEL